MSTPLYDALTQFAAKNPLRMAMPGHKGKPIPGLPAEYARLDFTELSHRQPVRRGHGLHRPSRTGMGRDVGG